jgi:hypothetical protein
MSISAHFHAFNRECVYPAPHQTLLVLHRVHVPLLEIILGAFTPVYGGKVEKEEVLDCQKPAVTDVHPQNIMQLSS